jgi:hypothetical protein
MSAQAQQHQHYTGKAHHYGDTAKQVQWLRKVVPETIRTIPVSCMRHGIGSA